jgi:hypothetical protein
MKLINDTLEYIEQLLLEGMEPHDIVDTVAVDYYLCDYIDIIQVEAAIESHINKVRNRSST